MSILTDILIRKKVEVNLQRRKLPLNELEQSAVSMPPNINFFDAINTQKTKLPNLIAEIKQRSPSKGNLCKDFDPIKLAKIYSDNGASAISILTDEYFFGGSINHLQSIYNLNTGLPLLRKDFIFNRYQLLQSKIAGASATLLIVAMLDPAILNDLILEAFEIGLDVIVEVHNTQELDIALNTKTKIIGINNRNLHTFKTSLDTTKKLRPLIPKEICVVAESGIHNSADVKLLAQLKVNSMLIGESIVTASDIGSKIRHLIQVKKTS